MFGPQCEPGSDCLHDRGTARLCYREARFAVRQELLLLVGKLEFHRAQIAHLAGLEDELVKNGGIDGGATVCVRGHHSSDGDAGRNRHLPDLLALSSDRQSLTSKRNLRPCRIAEPETHTLPSQGFSFFILKAKFDCCARFQLDDKIL